MSIIIDRMRQSPDTDSPTTPRELFEEVVYPPKAPLTLNIQLAADHNSRQPPLTYDDFKTFFDEDGRLVHENRLRQAVFKGTSRACVLQCSWKQY